MRGRPAGHAQAGDITESSARAALRPLNSLAVALRALLQRLQTADPKALAEFVGPSGLWKVEANLFVASQVEPGGFGKERFLRRITHEMSLDESGYRMA